MSFTLLAVTFQSIALHAQQGTFRQYYFDTAGIVSFYNNGALAEVATGIF